MKNLIIKYRLTLSLVFYQVVISLRILTEMGLCSIHTFIHQLVWFNTVFLIFFLGFIKILKVDSEKLWLLSSGSLLTFIPLIYSYLTGHQWALNYIQPVSLLQIVTDLSSLLCCHEYNWPMFPELLLLFTGSFGLAYHLSKNVKKSIICSTLSFYSSFLLLGFSWIAVNKDHPTLFLLRSSFSDSKFYSLQLITYFIVILSVVNYKSVYNYFKDFRKIHFHALNFFVAAVLYSIVIYLTNNPLTVADNLVTVVPILFISYTLKTRKSELNVKTVTAVWISALSLLAMVTNSRI